MSNFNPPEVVGRGSETQLQVGENLNKITYSRKKVDKIVENFIIPPSFLSSHIFPDVELMLI